MKKPIERYFDSPMEFLHKLENTKAVPGDRHFQNASDKRDRGFTDTNSLSHALELAKNGDPNTAKLIMPTDVFLQQHGAMNANVYDYTGDNVDVGRYLSGEPECMMSLRKRGKPIINILVNIAASHYVDKSNIWKRGKAICEIMSGLETNGYGVDITIINAVQGTTGSWFSTPTGFYYRLKIKIKDSKEYFNVESLAFWLVSPSVLRRLNFKQVEQEPADIQDEIGAGYGNPMDLPQEELDAMPDCVYFPIIRDNDTARYESSIKQVLETYKI